MPAPRFGLRTLMIVVAVVAASMAAFRGTGAMLFGNLCELPLALATFGALRCAWVRGHRRAFWVGVMAGDGLGTIHLLMAWDFRNTYRLVGGSKFLWERYNGIAEDLLSAAWPTWYLSGEVTDVMVKLIMFLPIGVFACVAGLLARWAFHLCARRRVAGAGSPAPIEPRC